MLIGKNICLSSCIIFSHIFLSKRIFGEAGAAGYASGRQACSELLGGLANQAMVDPTAYQEAYDLLGGAGINFRVDAKYR